jgi:methyl-accepting chemotaxis protein
MDLDLHPELDDEVERIEHTVADTEAIAAVATSVTSVAGGTVVQQLPEMNPDLEEATSNYVEELRKLTEMLSRISEQSEKLGRNSEEMDNLDRTITGICKVYEMQLKSASAQIGTIDQINDQTRHLAEQIAELNKIYARMIEAMTVNMPAAAQPAASKL